MANGFSTHGLTSSQFSSVSQQIRLGQASILSSLAETRSDLFQQYAELDQNQRNYEIATSNLLNTFYAKGERANLNYQTLQNKIEYSNQLANVELEKILQQADFSKEYSNLRFGRDRTSNFLNYKKSIATLSRDEDLLAISIEQLESQKDLRDESFKAQKSGIKSLLKANREILDSLGITRGLIGEREGVVDEQVGIAQQITNVEGQAIQAQANAQRFLGQQRVAEERALRQLTTGAYSEVLASTDLEKTSVEMSAQLEAAASQMEKVELKQAQIVQEYKKDKIGIALQKESVERQVSSTKGRIGRLKAQIKGLNARRKLVNNEMDFLIRGKQRRIEAIGEFKEIALKDYKSQKAFLSAVNKYNQKVADFNIKIGKKLNTIGISNNERNLRLAYRRLNLDLDLAARDYVIATQREENKRNYNEALAMANIRNLREKESNLQGVLDDAESGDEEALGVQKTLGKGGAGKSAVL